MTTLRVRNMAQKVLFDEELSGQISDGMWENARPSNHWQVWTRAAAAVDPTNPGLDCYPPRRNHTLTAKSLLEIIGERMIKQVQRRVDATYDEKRLRADLRDLKEIMKLTSLPAPVVLTPAPEPEFMISLSQLRKVAAAYSHFSNPDEVKAVERFIERVISYDES